ncbi:MAG: hypothetical protein ACQESE_00370 [Nanobdellota archaeon]
MTVSLIISIVALIISGGAAYMLWRFNKRLDDMTSEISDKFSDLDIEKKLSSMTNGQGTTSLDDITKTIFLRVKQKFGLSAKSYFEAVEQIKNTPSISKDMRELLIGFFNDIIHISYRDVELSFQKQEELKKKTKLIIKSLQE